LETVNKYKGQLKIYSRLKC